jgi:acetyl esterase
MSELSGVPEPAVSTDGVAGVPLAARTRQLLMLELGDRMASIRSYMSEIPGSTRRLSLMTSPLTLRELVEHNVVRSLAALPPGVQVRLSGRPPVQIDGDTLAPEVQLSLALFERRRVPSLEEMSLAEARRTRRRLAVISAGRPEPVGAVRDLEIDADVPLRARHYAPVEQGRTHPLLVFFHGGGFVYGDLDSHDGICRLLCRHAGAQVLAVDYRLAPEHPFPAAVEDARAALRWAFANAGRLDADPNRIGVGGDSAGGNLAAVVSQLATRDGGAAPALQLLMYPALDSTGRHRSRELFGDEFFPTQAHLDWFEAQYLGAASEQRSDPRTSPLLAEDFSELPPALVVTAAFDPLRDEGEAYAEALRAAGTHARVRRFPGLIHGFANAAGVSRRCRDAVIEIAGVTRSMFAALPSHRRSRAA